jgi:hypothetical protein
MTRSSREHQGTSWSVEIGPDARPPEGAVVEVHDQADVPLVRIIETDGDVVELAATTEKGEVRIITGMTREGDTLILKGLHIDGPGAGSLGLRELRDLATDLGRQQGARRVTIYGGTRTTGANPGHTPRPMTLPVGEG